MLRELSLRAVISLTPQVGANESNIQAATAAQPTVYFPNMTLVNRTISQNAAFQRVSSEIVYVSDYRYLAGRVLVTFIAALGTAPLFFGW